VKRGLYRAKFDVGTEDTSAARSSRRSVDVSPPRDCPHFARAVTDLPARPRWTRRYGWPEVRPRPGRGHWATTHAV